MVYVKPFNLKRKEGENNKSYKFVAISFSDEVEENLQNEEKKINRRFNTTKRRLVLQNYTNGEKDKSKRDIILTSCNWTKIKLHFDTINKWFSEDENNSLSMICLEDNRYQNDNDDDDDVNDTEEEEEEQEMENYDFVDKKRKRKILISSSCDYEYQRMLSFSIFKDKKYVHIRTYYNLTQENNGEKKLIPTKTGVCLSSTDWEKFKTYFDIINKIFLDDRIFISEFGIFEIFQLPRYNSFVEKFSLF